MAKLFVHTRSIVAILQDYAIDNAISPKQQRHILRQYRQQILQRQFPHLDIAIDHNGKPYCQNQCVFFNHTHSQKHYALIYSTDIPHLGIDIENLDRQARFSALAQRYFHPDELAFWQQQSANPTTWLQIWTAKEALLKACGLGIRMPLKQLNTLDSQPTQHHFHSLTHAQLGHFYLQHHLIENTMLCLAIYRPTVMHLPPIQVEMC